jgi:hypothetical protein
LLMVGFLSLVGVFIDFFSSMCKCWKPWKNKRK